MKIKMDTLTIVNAGVVFCGLQTISTKRKGKTTHQNKKKRIIDSLFYIYRATFICVARY